MKFKIIVLLAGLAILGACQNSSKKATEESTTKSCCTDSVKSCSEKSEKGCCSSDTTKSCCSKKSENKSCCQKSDTIPVIGVQVLYFHNERRCATCMAVEEGATNLISMMDSTQVSFHSYQIGNMACAELEKKYEIAGQTLLLIGIDTTIDLTNLAFMNARVKPEVYKEELRKAIEGLE